MTFVILILTKMACGSNMQVVNWRKIAYVPFWNIWAMTVGNAIPRLTVPPKLYEFQTRNLKENR